MSNVFITSDTHFFHDKDFIWGTRGFNSVDEMNEVIVEKWNSIVKPEDFIYHLGDVGLGSDVQKIIEIIKRLNGHIYLAYGNHDTGARLYSYAEARLFDDIQMGYRFPLGKKMLWLSHFPMNVANEPPVLDYSVHGHLHQSYAQENSPFHYNVVVDAHDCTPVPLEEISSAFKIKQKGNVYGFSL